MTRLLRPMPAFAPVQSVVARRRRLIIVAQDEALGAVVITRDCRLTNSLGLG
jgi:hypothetical protein